MFNSCYKPGTIEMTVNRVENETLDSLLGQAQALARGEVGSRELTERALGRIEATQPTLNAFRVVCDE
jgi:Asp-tRNA(Asn)/Glu-tRNA(Gln) amidotransferase A subunit family amidase